jgi:alpha-galactosidase
MEIMNYSNRYTRWALLLLVGASGLAGGNALAAEGTPEEMGLAFRWVMEQHLAGRAPVAPFSFTYGGKPSSELLPGWQRESRVDAFDSNHVRITRIASLTNAVESIRTLTWTDPKTGLEVRCVAATYPEFPAVDWVVYFKNTGQADTPILESIQALDFRLDTGRTGFTIHHALGDGNSALSFAPMTETVAGGDARERVYAPAGGRSSQGRMPYFNLGWPGGGMALAIGWSGQWEAGFQTLPSGELRVRAGQQLTHFKLHPGESARTPRGVITFWRGSDDLRGNNLFRSLALAHYYPRREGRLVYPPICGTVNYAAPDGSYEQPHLLAPGPLKARGVEVLWSDMDPQQWYPGGFPNGTGNWEVDTNKYPRGLKPIGDAVRAAGLQYLLWFEPERVHPGTRIDREHPEWVMPAKGEWSQLFRLHDPVARQWLTDLIDTQITAAQLGWLRWDFNMDPLGFWRRNDAPDRQGITEIRHIEGLYAMWAELQKRHPGLIIDNCSSGGRRLDIEACRYGLPLWHSDSQCGGKCDPTPDQLQNAALYRWVPLHGCGCFALEPAYGFRSAMTAGNILAPSETQCRLDTPSPEVEAAVKRTTALYRKLRPFMLGDFYPLFSHATNETAWFGYQFHREREQDGFAMVFRRGQSLDLAQTLPLRGIDAQARYTVSFEDSAETRAVTGAGLAAFRLEIPATPGSAILYYRKTGDGSKATGH